MRKNRTIKEYIDWKYEQLEKLRHEKVDLMTELERCQSCEDAGQLTEFCHERYYLKIGYADKLIPIINNKIRKVQTYICDAIIKHNDRVLKRTDFDWNKLEV